MNITIVINGLEGSTRDELNRSELASADNSEACANSRDTIRPNELGELARTEDRRRELHSALCRMRELLVKHEYISSSDIETMLGIVDRALERDR